MSTKKSTQSIKQQQLADNSAFFEAEIKWFENVLQQRIQYYFEHNKAFNALSITPPKASNNKSDYAQYIVENNLDARQRLIIIMAFLPHLKPQSLDTFLIKNEQSGQPFTEFGGITSSQHKGVMPTIESALFLLCANNLAQRLECFGLFDKDQALLKLNILNIQHSAQSAGPFASAPLSLNPELVDRFLLNKHLKPNYSINFPAQLLENYLTWNDLILNHDTKAELDHIFTWLKQTDLIMHTWDLQRHIKKGYRALFYGPPGTGKSLSASLLGKRMGMDVYQIDLSALVSKYIGETEKNLANVFDQAEQKNWILFFDEADALFSKRSSGSSSNDRHSNQEIAYLLQRIENFDGTVILASNLKDNMDDAFTRRFQSIVYFPMPNTQERLLLWRNMLNKQSTLAPCVDLPALAEQYELSGGAMTNVIRYAAINTLQRGNQAIEHRDLEKGISRELRKEGKLISWNSRKQGQQKAI